MFTFNGFVCFTDIPKMKSVKKLIILELHCWANKSQGLNMMNLEGQCKYACLLNIMFIHIKYLCNYFDIDNLKFIKFF